MNLRQVRKKTKSIRNVKKITKAMQLVSAIKMRKAQAAEVDGRPYRDTLTSVLTKLMESVETDSSTLLKPQKITNSRTLIIFVSSNKGLCGSFHVNLFRLLIRKNVDFRKSDFITVGTKATQFVSKMGGKVLADFSEGKFLNSVSAIFSLALTKFLAAEYSSVSLIYSKYLSTFRSEVVEEVLMPVKWPKQEAEKKVSTSQYLVEPSPEDILEPLIKSYLEERIRGAIISSEAVEHASRMIAMKNATDNATDIVYNLTLVGNKLRQEKITGELLDMITAKESVEST